MPRSSEAKTERNQKRREKFGAAELAATPYRFWMISGSAGPPRKRYFSLAEATADAIKLAKDNGPHRFHLLEAIGFWQSDGENAVPKDYAP